MDFEAIKAAAQNYQADMTRFLREMISHPSESCEEREVIDVYKRQFVTLTDEHIVPDADDVRHEGHHIGGFPDGLAVGDLRLLFVQILNLQTQQITGGGKGEAGAGGVVPEDGDTQTGIKDPGGLIPLPEIP